MLFPAAGEAREGDLSALGVLRSGQVWVRLERVTGAFRDLGPGDTSRPSSDTARCRREGQVLRARRFPFQHVREAHTEGLASGLSMDEAPRGDFPRSVPAERPFTPPTPHITLPSRLVHPS